jgi:CubicO group peptidase (beta-lactamase class C family)
MSAKHVQLVRRLVFPLALLGCLLLSACAGSSPAQSAPTRGVSKSPAFAAKLQPLLLAKMQQLHIPGALIFVDLPGQGSWTTALGTSDLATHAPMNVNSHMRIASITKTMTATIILQLVDAGKLRLDDPVSTYQPQVPNGAHITIRELLNMTSGLFNYAEDEGFLHAWQADPGKVWNPQEELAIAFKHAPYFAPGKGFHYSNTNYRLLGLIIEQLTHQPVEEVFQQRIFTPLKMNESSFPPATSAAIPDPHPQGYMYGTILDLLEGPKPNAAAGAPHDVTSWNPSQGWTSGSVISTLHDLQIWAKVLATGKLVSAVAHQEQLSFTPQSHGTYGLGVTNYMGLICHNGADPGFTSWMSYQPQTGATIVVLTNLYPAPDGSVPATELAQVIIQQKLFA